MATARIRIQAHIDDTDVADTFPLSLLWEIATANGTVQVTPLTTGNNQLSFTAGTTCVWIVPPATNTATIILKGANGDTGFTLQSSKPNLVSYSAGNIVLNVSSNVTVTAVYL